MKKYILLNVCECGGKTEIRLYKQLFAWCPACRKFSNISNLKRFINGKKIKNTTKQKPKYTLKELKTMDYDRYLRTGHWGRIRKKYWATHKKICFCCEDGSYVLHHNNYSRRGEEQDKDLVPLCEECHNDIHTLILNDEQITLKNGHIVKKQLLRLSF